MAIKLKNFLYNPISKLFTIFLMLVSVAAIIYVSVQMVISGFTFDNDSYYETYGFSRDYDRLAHNVVEKLLVLENEANILAMEQDETETNNMISRLRVIEANLDQATGFKYVLHNKVDDSMMTNMTSDDPVSDIGRMPTSLKFEYGKVYYPSGSHMSDYMSNNVYYTYIDSHEAIIELLHKANESTEEDWVYYTALDPSLDASDGFFYEDSMRFETFHANRLVYIFVLSIGILVGLFALFMFFYTTGKHRAGEPATMVFYDKIPQEVQMVIASLFAVPLIVFTSNRYSGPDPNELIIMIGLSCFVVLGTLMYLASLIRVIKCGKFWSSILLVRCLGWVVNALKKLFGFIKPPTLDESYKWQILKWIAIWLGANLVGLLMLSGPWQLGLIAIGAINLFSLKWLLKQAEGLKVIMTTVAQRRQGHHDNDIVVEALPTMFREFGDNLESLQEGLEVAVEARIKGEKMKTELITNVTHDLKNPLTSIISYIELLKGKDEMDEASRKYIEVLEEKAARLKSLIDQLVEAAKASSGTLAVNMTSVDIIQLLRQLCGEYMEVMEKRSLNCVLPNLDKKVTVKADPLILYRILDNMMSNVCKYSMEGTRVYLIMEEEDNRVKLSVKNISKDPLTMDVADLSQRFVRGDSSRNTEGSGLGISIALSLSKLIGAVLTFDTDGDLFKGVLLLKKGTEIAEVEQVEVEMVTDL